MAPEDVPLVDLAEQLTTRRLLESLKSERCPACGEGKFSRHTFCGRCYRRLSSQLKTRLYARIDSGYDRAVAAAMKHLGKKRFIMPADDVSPIGQISAVSTLLTQELLDRSLHSVICPKCAGAKQGGYCLCHGCRGKLRAACADVDLFAINTATVADSLQPALLKSDPAQYGQLMAAAIRRLRGNVFHFPKE
jgi:hypothetical protein